jgi:hypothetical protein
MPSSRESKHHKKPQCPVSESDSELECFSNDKPKDKHKHHKKKPVSSSSSETIDSTYEIKHKKHHKHNKHDKCNSDS